MPYFLKYTNTKKIMYLNDVPVIVMLVPPPVPPRLGEMSVIVGAMLSWYAYCVPDVSSVLPSDTMTSHGVVAKRYITFKVHATVP